MSSTQSLLAVWVLAAGACAAPPTRTSDSPGIAFPTTLGEGSEQPGKERREPRPGPTRDAADEAQDATAGAAPASSSVPASSSAPAPGSAPASTTLSPPDPEPLRTAAQWQYEIAAEGGALSVASVERRDLPKPIVTARRMGRYAIELWVGNELIERVRFDLPLLAGERDAVGKGAFAPPDLEKGAHARTRVMVPRSERARRAVLVDRARETYTPLPWPPAPDPRPQRDRTTDRSPPQPGSPAPVSPKTP